jgi:hypothetical protein
MVDLNRIMGPLEDLVPPAKVKGDPLPPESMEMRRKMIEEEQSARAKKRNEISIKVSEPKIPKEVFDVMHRLDVTEIDLHTTRLITWDQVKAEIEK